MKFHYLEHPFFVAVKDRSKEVEKALAEIRARKVANDSVAVQQSGEKDALISKDG